MTILAIILALALIICVVFIVHNRRVINYYQKSVENRNKELVSLSEKLGRAEREYSAIDKHYRKLLSENQALKDQLDKINVKPETVEKPKPKAKKTAKKKPAPKKSKKQA